MSAPTLSVCAAALRRAEVLYARRDTNIDAAREAAFALLNDSGGEFDGGALLKQCLVAMSDDPFSALGCVPKRHTRRCAGEIRKRPWTFQSLYTGPDKAPETGPYTVLCGPLRFLDGPHMDLLRALYDYGALSGPLSAGPSPAAPPEGPPRPLQRLV
ncbi:hypothetical protein M885DRAFT_243498 [Pelagophyceae sp. CCMP2097]|nr:hypothetical protein M885DRAFT_243498 [Pelagophyceae sp. CCMP2097]